jgi:membrane fusion protein (multidrug efflux system)
MKYILKTFRAHSGYPTACGGMSNLDSALLKKPPPKGLLEESQTQRKTANPIYATSFPRKRESRRINGLLDARFHGHDISGLFRVRRKTFSTSPKGWATRFVLLVLVVAICSCGNKQDTVEKERAAVAVKVTVVGFSDEEIVKTYTGTLEGEKQAVIYAKIAEAVKAVHVREGQHVKADQVLISLDKSGPSSRYQEALSLYRNAEKNYKKMEYLYGEGAVSESQFDAANTQYEVTKAGFEAASQLVEVQSPIDGVVTSLKVSKGDFLVPGQELATVATVDRLRVKFGVNAAAVGSLMQGIMVTVSSGDATRTVKGAVLSVARSADPVTRTFQVEVVLDNSEGMFRPGVFVRINIPLEQLTGVVVVPRQAVIARRGEEVVFVVSNGVAQEREVTTGADLGGRIVITSGLNAGDTLVTLGQDYLQDGIDVNITDIVEGEQ